MNIYFKVYRTLAGPDISIVANTVNALLGVSIFAMPWGYLKSGIIGGSILVFGVCLLSFETARVLLVAQRILYYRTGEIKSYPEIAAITMGNTIWSTVVQTATIISCIGGCIGYLIFLGETIGQMFSIPLRESIYFATIPLILLSWVRSFRNLSFFTILGVIALFLAILAVIYDGLTKMKTTVDDAPYFMPLGSTLNFLGPTTFLFTIHYCVLSMGAESLHDKIDPEIELSHLYQSTPLYDDLATTSVDMSEMSESGSQKLPTAPMLARPLLIAYIISALLICFLGTGGFIVYRNAEVVQNLHGIPEPGCLDHVCQNVIMNLSAGFLRILVGIAMIISILLSYIILLAPAREHIELVILRSMYSTHEDFHGAKYLVPINIIRTCLVLFTSLIALITPYFGSVLGAVGGLTDALQAFVLPPLIFMSIHQGHLNSFQKGFYNIIFFLGVATISYTLINVFNFLPILLQRN